MQNVLILLKVMKRVLWGTIIVNILCIEFKLGLSECLLCICPSLTFCVYNNKHFNLLISKCVDSTAIFSQSALLPRY